MSQKNMAIMQKVEAVTRGSIREKVLAYLSQQAQRSGSRSIDIPFNRQELAAYLGVDRSALSTELGKLRSEGILEFRKNHFKLL